MSRSSEQNIAEMVLANELVNLKLSEINSKLESLSEEPAIEGVHFTAFAIR